MENKKTIIITLKQCVGEHEHLAYWYKCSNCNNAHISEEYNFCPICGIEIDWQL